MISNSNDIKDNIAVFSNCIEIYNNENTMVDLHSQFPNSNCDLQDWPIPMKWLNSSQSGEESDILY